MATISNASQFVPSCVSRCHQPLHALECAACVMLMAVDFLCEHGWHCWMFTMIYVLTSLGAVCVLGEDSYTMHMHAAHTRTRSPS